MTLRQALASNHANHDDVPRAPTETKISSKPPIQLLRSTSGCLHTQYGLFGSQVPGRVFAQPFRITLARRGGYRARRLTWACPARPLEERRRTGPRGCRPAKTRDRRTTTLLRDRRASGTGVVAACASHVAAWCPDPGDAGSGCEPAAARRRGASRSASGFAWNCNPNATGNPEVAEKLNNSDEAATAAARWLRASAETKTDYELGLQSRTGAPCKQVRRAER